jgi:Asp-tRNA(Asn)/Glu-tRNA(Gln) amidotransferase A subunit family amidase
MKAALPYQSSLFEGQQLPTPAVVLDIKKAVLAKDEGIERAGDHADEVDPEWNNKAFEFLKRFIANHNGTFMTEEVRVYAEQMDLGRPPDNRAWGGVIKRALNKGMIESCGYSKTRNVKAHRTPAAVWRAVMTINKNTTDPSI